MPPQSAELKVTTQTNCPPTPRTLRFHTGMEVLIFDDSGNFDTFTITKMQDDAGPPSAPWHGSQLQVRGRRLHHADGQLHLLSRSPTNQLKRYDGTKEEALVDNVVDLRFDYFGDPNPPQLPKPLAGVDNCLYDAAGNYADLPMLSATDGRSRS